MTYAVPIKLVCDKVSNFIGHPARKLVEDYKFKASFIPRGNQQATSKERKHRKIGNVLKTTS